MAQLVLLRMANPFRDIATAGYAMTRRMETFANFGIMGLGQAGRYRGWPNPWRREAGTAEEGRVLGI